MSSTAKAIMAARPAPILLVPRVPSSTDLNSRQTTSTTAKSTKKARKLLAEKKPPVEPAYRPPVQESVPTDGKPRKNQAGLLSKELEHFRDLLLEKRREIVGDMSSMEREALRAGAGGLSSLPVHMADMGTDNYEQEFTLGLVEKDRILLRELNAALAKIQNGTYGLCEGTGKPINKVRLEAQPWARFSIEWAREMEKNRGIR
jgi:RNA polymerase-binding protein DksA